MSYLNFTFVSIKKNLTAFILMVLELSFMLLLVNYSVSTIQERQMLNTPFEEILNEKTIYVDDSDFINKHFMQGLNSRQSRQEILNEVIGDYKIYDVLSYISGEYTVISVSDEIYSRLNIPLAVGSYKTGVGTFGTSLGEHSIAIGDGQSLTVNVSGTLTESTFIPKMNSFRTSGFTTKDIFDVSVDEPNIIITNRTTIDDIKDMFTVSMGFFITIEEDFESNYNNLLNVAGLVTSEDVRKNSNAAFVKDVMSFFPVLICVLFIAIVSIVSISVIFSSQNEYSSGVLWVCGYSKIKILAAHSVNISMIMIVSIIIGSAALGILKLMKNPIGTAVNLGPANLISSIALCAILLFVSLIIPIIKIRKTSPIEYLGRAK